MSTALSLVPAAVEGHKPFARGDARLGTNGPLTYPHGLGSFADEAARLRTVIAGEELQDIVIPDLNAIDMDSRDGALTRGGGGMAYTDWAFAQLVSAQDPTTKTGLRRGESAPSGLAKAALWCAPLARAAIYSDVKAANTRRSGVLFRRFRDPVTGLLALRAVVTERHSAAAFDDLAVLGALETVLRTAAPEGDARAAFTRGWKFSRGSVVLPSSTDVSLAISFGNSEVGAASLSFSGSAFIKALDTTVVFPGGTEYNSHVQVASNRDATRRNHTLPRVNVSDARRGGIAQERMVKDIARALRASVALADGWDRALVDVMMDISISHTPEILGDLLMERGIEAETVKAIMAVMVADDRLLALPRGSAAHLAGAVAIVARQQPTYDGVLELQELAGAIVLDGWRFRV